MRTLNLTTLAAIVAVAQSYCKIYRIQARAPISPHTSPFQEGLPLLQQRHFVGTLLRCESTNDDNDNAPDVPVQPMAKTSTINSRLAASLADPESSLPNRKRSKLQVRIDYERDGVQRHRRTTLARNLDVQP